ncbi:GlxA family transcriptional regulator [Chitinophaga solisilvae]|uniref:GlxA family transcriptional regulator n=1 Tax=Chitinophaga solisilvae TaxID=1233460 RepID=A0A433WCL4_9BACT|nr:GlxA family transcriptional regulator [Chitinophaga solisilvae]NSL90365.1 GlxA family transcriptional regulator [Chitinophaga solisilvae]
MPHKKKLVVVVPMEGTSLMNIAGPCDVFTQANKVLKNDPATAHEGYEILIAAPGNGKRIMTQSGVEIVCNMFTSDIKRPIDTLLVAGLGKEFLENNHQKYYKWLKEVYPKLRRIGSICIGAFALARAGVLDGRRATTHWHYSDRFQQEHPLVKVDTNPFFIRDGNVFTSGGIASGLDLALAMLEEDYGRDLALAVARRLVIYLRRPGYQSQFGGLLGEQRYAHTIAGRLHEWMTTHLDKDLSVEQLALQMNMSPRNFARVFLKETALTPAKYVEKLRVDTARRFLEESDLSTEQIAVKCGLGSMVSMRRVFLRHLMVSPSDYRRTFRTALQPET